MYTLQTFIAIQNGLKGLTSDKALFKLLPSSIQVVHTGKRMRFSNLYSRPLFTPCFLRNTKPKERLEIKAFKNHCWTKIYSISGGQERCPLHIFDIMSTDASAAPSRNKMIASLVVPSDPFDILLAPFQACMLPDVSATELCNVLKKWNPIDRNTARTLLS